MPDTYSIREAAEICQMSYEAMRARVDRGVVRAVKRDGVRRIPHRELERTGLLPGSTEAAGDVESLRAENLQLRDELRELRLIPEQIEREWRARVEAENEARERAEAAAQEATARQREADLRLQQAEAQARMALLSEREAQREIGRLEERLRHRSLSDLAGRSLPDLAGRLRRLLAR